jgi:hypothetical protein
MSFWISVFHPEDTSKIPPPDMIPNAGDANNVDWIPAFTEWEEQFRKAHLYYEPLGGDYSIGVFWWEIASQLGLPMLTSLYRNGLQLETSAELQQLEHELNALQTYWDSHDLRTEPTVGFHGYERQHLQEQMDHVREAIRIAIREGAVLSIS